MAEFKIHSGWGRQRGAKCKPHPFPLSLPPPLGFPPQLYIPSAEYLQPCYSPVPESPCTPKQPSPSPTPASTYASLPVCLHPSQLPGRQKSILCPPPAQQYADISMSLCEWKQRIWWMCRGGGHISGKSVWDDGNYGAFIMEHQCASLQAFFFYSHLSYCFCRAEVAYAHVCMIEDPWEGLKKNNDATRGNHS